jgi:hypothetical protein
VLEAPQNAPPRGAYAMALYPGQHGPHQVDWYWQARFAAAIPRDTRVLLDRVGLPRLGTATCFEPQPAPERNPLEAVSQSVRFFWVMLLITAKYVARSPSEERMGLLPYAAAALAEVREFAGAPAPDEKEEPQAFPEEKLRLLRRLAGEMEALMPRVMALGVDVPVEVAPQAYGYLALVETITK